MLRCALHLPPGLKQWQFTSQCLRRKQIFQFSASSQVMASDISEATLWITWWTVAKFPWQDHRSLEDCLAFQLYFSHLIVFKEQVGIDEENFFKKRKKREILLYPLCLIYVAFLRVSQQWENHNQFTDRAFPIIETSSLTSQILL